MSKVTLIFEDQPDGKVKVVSTPPANELTAKFKSGHTLTPAEAMVCWVLLEALAESKRAEYNARKLNILEI